ncbi:helix-turn-helix domain-containing protein [Bifidobacterium longum]|uniref:helix-turn-helix domain-containing protein n=1 Tax=Bifidobacterium longum TaxID=216816 RepID=UPI001F601B78|nr:helix-turn-helix domain-containing protein [Bifidobacterium longum]
MQGTPNHLCRDQHAMLSIMSHHNIASHTTRQANRLFMVHENKKTSLFFFRIFRLSAILEQSTYSIVGKSRQKGAIMGTRSISNDSATYLPNTDDRRQLIDIKEALSGISEEYQRTVDRRFDEMTSESDFPIAMLKVAGSPDRPLTPELADVLLKVADQLARGKAVFVAPYDTQLTTQDAADFLGISRPTLIKLLEEGTIPFKKVGRHRRVMLKDLQEYATLRHQENLRTFDDLTKDENPRATLDNPLIS